MLLAASHGHHLVVVFLAKCGSNLNRRNLTGKGVWDYALEQKNAKLVMVSECYISYCLTTSTNNVWLMQAFGVFFSQVDNSYYQQF